MAFCFSVRTAVIAVVLSLPCSALCAQTQTHAEVIRGRVTTDSGIVISGAEVIATMAPNREVFRTTSDSGGRYELDIVAGTGDYLVYIAALGRKALRKRVTRVRAETTFVVDAKLAHDVAVMAAVRTTARKTRPLRDDDTPSDIGALPAEYGTVVGALSPDQMNDLNAMAATMPGVAITPEGGVSVFGVDPGQNKTTVNGLELEGISLPRDMYAATRIRSSVYDPTVGGFGGAVTSVTLSRSFSAVTTARGHIALDAPFLEAADASPTARQLGQPYTNLSASYQRAGELQQDLWGYTGALQGIRHASAAPSILRSDAAALARFGVARDSADHFLQLLDALGIPNSADGVGADATTTTLFGSLRLDRAISNVPGDTRPHLSLIGIGNYHRTDPSSASPLAPPAHDNHNESGTGALQAIVSQYFGADGAYLSETRMGVSLFAQQSNPYLSLPGGAVRVTSVLDDGTQAIAGLQFGGAQSASNTRFWQWEANNELSFNPTRAPSHRIKLYSQAQLAGYDQASQANGLGSFSYNSLADLAANTPASYSRTLFSPNRIGEEASGAFAIADYWNESPNLQFVFGPRVEWNAFTRAPSDNPEIARLFGVRTSNTPSEVAVIPRVGFSWVYRGRKTGNRNMNQLAVWGSDPNPPSGVLRGGVGEFRSQLSPSLVSDAIASTGLAGTTTQRLTCVGPAAPTPDWQDYLGDAAAVPSSCANGAGTGVFTDAAPSVQLFDPAYTAPRRWTGTLGWSSAYKALVYTLDAFYSHNIDQMGRVDLNYTGVPRFTLANEVNRPVYVAPASIDPSSGLLSPIDSRVSTEFGSVVERKSDLRTDVKTATVTLAPAFTHESLIVMSGSYTFSSSRSLTSGYDGTTFGDPRQLSWATGYMPTHLVKLAFGVRLPIINSLFSTSWGFQSGYPYTPIVGGDINGDGLSNDRAFVFDPARAPSAAVASGLSTLLATTTPEVRDCLQRQLGAVAGVNSCRRPWSAITNARLDWSKRFGDSYHNVHGSINFANPLSGLDQLLHGSDRLRGWGAPASPDQTLYFVRGFDQTTGRFTYEVNPRFGNSRPSLGALINPFRVTLDISFTLNGNIERQKLDIFMRPARGAPGVRPPADTILRRIRTGTGNASNPFPWIIANADSLLASPGQIAAIQAAQTAARIKTDSTYKALSIELEKLPADYNPDVVTAHVRDVTRSVIGMEHEFGVIVGRVLTKTQIGLLPAIYQRMVEIPVPGS
jgi:hypothetical protein